MGSRARLEGCPCARGTGARDATRGRGSAPRRGAARGGTARTCPAQEGLPPAHRRRPGGPASRSALMDRRIFGIETEYGVTCAVESGRGLSADEVARYLFRKVVAWGRSSNVFLRNGSRLYLDVGSHPEYATAECDEVPQLVAHDRAGERVLEGLVVDAQQRLEHEGVPGTIHLFKNNTDSALSLIHISEP